MLPPMLPKKKHRTTRVRCQSHLAWVRKHRCCVPGCMGDEIQAAHVRSSCDGGMGQKPGDQWTISLCLWHHMQQHEEGEPIFQKIHGIDMIALAKEFAAKSPYRAKLLE